MSDGRLFEPTDSPRLEYLSYNEAAAGLSISVRTLIRWVREGRIPGPLYVGMYARFPLTYVADVLRVGVGPKGSHKPPASFRAEAGQRRFAPAPTKKVKPKPVTKSKKKKTTKPVKKPAKKGGAK